MLRRFICDEDGAVSIEYALIAVGTTLVIVSGLTPVGSNLAAMIAQVSNALQ